MSQQKPKDPVQHPDDVPRKIIKALIKRKEDIAPPKSLMKAVVILGYLTIVTMILYLIFSGVAKFNWAWHWSGWVWFVCGSAFAFLLMWLGVERLVAKWYVHYIITLIYKAQRKIRRKQIKERAREVKKQAKIKFDNTTPKPAKLSEDSFKEILIAEVGDGNVTLTEADEPDNVETS